ncbi:MAG: apolipoprotein N-acyltransferase [Candidatus Saganbacteria bacterium]|nr:apolipoprotein N-acyltransferase [Candidatus Saganbacteria bacterium]
MLLAIVSGLLLALAFPKFNLYWLAFLALVPFFVALIKAKDLKEALLCGFFFGIFFFAIHLSWMWSLFRFVSWWIALGWVGLVFYQTLFILAFSFLAYFLGNPKRVVYPIIMAFLFAAIEWIRAWGPFGVTGGDISYSQVDLLPLIQIASFAGVYGITFLVVLVNASLAQFLLDRRKWQGLIISLLLIVLALGYGFYVLRQDPPLSLRPLKIALIQPNIDQEEKMSVASIIPVFKVHEELSRKAAQEKPNIIIWPETSVFSYLLHNSQLLPRLRRLSRDTGAWIIFGTPHYIGSKTYNSLVCISPSGEVVSRYDKQHLVPFAEYLPFSQILYPIFKGVGYYDNQFDSNPKVKMLILGDLKIAPAICFESTFPSLIRERASQGADFILTATNDAWFGNSAAPYFHLNTAIFRAIENRKYVIFVANTGISAVIDPFGRILKKTELNTRRVLTFEIALP